jgi:ribosomal protein S18 acetylase RimI-like enzyme
VRIVEIADEDIEPVVALWERCGLTRPWNDPRADIALARLTASSTLLVGWDGETLVATAMAGSDGHRGWIYYVGVEPEARRAGLGREIMQAAETWLREHGVRKVHLMVRGENAAVQGFYRELGYEPQEVVVLGKRF